MGIFANILSKLGIGDKDRPAPDVRPLDPSKRGTGAGAALAHGLGQGQPLPDGRRPGRRGQRAHGGEPGLPGGDG